MQGCTTTGYIGILRAAPPTKSAAEKTPATPFSREEMAWTAMAAIHIVAHILRTKVDHLPRAPTSRTRLNPQAAALPQKSTHQLRSCSWPEVHTISRVQNEPFPRGVALMIASVPARSQPNRPKPIGLSRPNSHHFTFFTCYPILFWEKLFARGFGRCSRVEYAAK